MAFDIHKIREDFPILNRMVNGSKLVYLDNAASSQKPNTVIESIKTYYQEYNANIHRGVHTLSQEATEAYEQARKKVQAFFNAKKDCEIIFTQGTTQSINLVASSFTNLVKPGDEIMISYMEHHSNIVPWQLLCERTGAKLVVLPIKENGELEMENIDNYINPNTKLVAITHISNGIGVINPIEEIIAKAHAVNAAVLIDGAQACAHIKPDVQALNVDFYATSAHKMCGPTGVGILYGKEEWLNKLPPYQGGGEMIKEVSFEKTTYADLPHKFEAGTPNISGGIAFGVALDYLNNIGFDAIAKQEEKLLEYATKQLKEIHGLKIYGDVANKASLVSFNIEGIHPYDIGTILDQMGIAVRTGHHCTQPIMDFFGIPGTVRASFAFYNSLEEVDSLVAAVKKAKQMLS